MIGETVLHYKIVEKLGGGGMGVVYKAEDTKLGRFVALKFLPEEMSRDESAMERFMLEARAAAALSHPHICTIHEINEYEGRSFIAMEYLDGQSLKFAIAGRPMPLDMVIDISIQVSEALGAAHDKGITHRDIKPSNIFIKKNGQAKIVDFGLAKLTPQYRVADDDETMSAESALMTDQDLTRSGTALGTVSYMSPEQALGEQIDPRSDIFSLGAVLYEMSTGRQAFGGNTQAAIFNHLLNQPPTSPARIGITLPYELERIISTALEKDANMRYQDASNLIADLRRLRRDHESGQSVPGMAAVSREQIAQEMADAPSSPFEVGTEEPTASAPVASVADSGQTSQTEIEIAIQKNQRWMGLLTVGLVIALALAGGLWWNSTRTPTAALSETDTLLLTDFENTTGDPVFDGTLKEALAVKLEESPFLKLAPDRVIDETKAFMELDPEAQVTKDIGQEICQRQGFKAMVTGGIASLGSDYVVTLTALECSTGEVLGRQQTQASSKEGVLASLGEAAAALRTSLGESLASVEQFDAPIEQATTASLEALKFFSQGVEKRREGFEEEAIVSFERAIELDPEFALAHARLGTVLTNLREWERGVAEKTLAYELKDEVSDKENFYITAHYHSSVTGELDKLISAYELWKQTYPRDWTPPNNLAGTFNDIGRHEDALRDAQLAVEIEPNEALPHTTLAQAYLYAGQVDQAKRAAQSAIDTGFVHYSLYETLYQAAFLEGDETAMASYVEAMRGRAGEAWLLHESAGAAAAGGRLTEARRLTNEAVEAARRFGFESQVAYFYAMAARSEAAFGNIEEARDLALEALEVARNRETLPTAAIALGLSGAADEALQVIGELGGLFPTDTIIQEVEIPIAMAAVVRAQGDPLGAVKVLESTTPYERGKLAAIYVRGLAYLAAQDGAAAAAEFRKLQELASVEATRPVHTLAYLGMARAYALSGVTGVAKEQYEEFFRRMERADGNLPVLQQARAEYAALN